MTQEVCHPVTGEPLNVPDNWVLFNGVPTGINDKLAEYIAWSFANQSVLLNNPSPPTVLRTVIERMLLCGVRTELRLHGLSDAVIETITANIVAGNDLQLEEMLAPSPPPSHPNSTSQLLLHERRRRQEKELADKRAKAEIEARLERMVSPVIRIFDELRELGVRLKCHGHNGTLNTGPQPAADGFVIPSAAQLRVDRSRTVQCFLVGSNDSPKYRRYLRIWPENIKGAFSYVCTWGDAEHNDRQVFTDTNVDSLRHWVMAAIAAHEYSPPDVLDPAYRLPPTEKPTRVISIDENP